MNIESILNGAGIALLVIYFVRRMYWLSKGNRHNLVTGETDLGEKGINKSHDWISWVLLGLGAILVLGSNLCC